MSITEAVLRERLQRDLPHALAPTQLAAQPIADAAETSLPTTPKAKPELARADPLATSNVVVVPAQVPPVAFYLRDMLGYTLLSNITAVDYLASNIIELIYHFINIDAGGPPLVIKTRLPRADPRVPSLTPDWPGADLQEREAFDLYGVDFPGHPNLRRVYMWDEFEGWPMRKDFPKHGDKYFTDE